MGSAVFHIYQK